MGGDVVWGDSATEKFEPFDTVPKLDPISRPELVEPLVDSLCSTDGIVSLTAIEGMGGVGKTMVAVELCNDKRIQEHFRDGILWTPIGKQSGLSAENRIQWMAEHLNKKFPVYDPAAYSALLREKTVLVVLDDVWSVADIEPFLLGQGPSRLLYTTRVREIAVSVGAQNWDVGILNEKQGRAFLARWSGYPDRPMPEPQATEIIEECGGLALVSMIGAALKNKPVERWSDVLANLKSPSPQDIKMALARHTYPSLYASIAASIAELSREDRNRYENLALLLEDMAAPPFFCGRYGVLISTRRER